jgi:hypothetical protein
MLAIFYKDEKIVEENTHAKQDAHLKQNITSLLKWLDPINHIPNSTNIS